MYNMNKLLVHPFMWMYTLIVHLYTLMYTSVNNYVYKYTNAYTTSGGIGIH